MSIRDIITRPLAEVGTVTMDPVDAQTQTHTQQHTHMHPFIYMRSRARACKHVDTVINHFGS